MRRRCWVKALLMIYVLPWAVPVLLALGAYALFAVVERVPLLVPAAIVDAQHDGGTGAISHSDESAWNYMMVTAVLCRLAPVASNTRSAAGWHPA
ncbi:MAG: hypothetical protein JO358_11355 [Alphaproteobacteria bacterium]|nr:hypothetical protein [Alphaproteobacteria bacterium]